MPDFLTSGGLPDFLSGIAPDVLTGDVLVPDALMASPMAPDAPTGDAPHPLPDDAPDVLARYATAALVAERILRAAELDGHETQGRRFALVPSADAHAPPDLLVWLLSPYVTLATNHPFEPPVGAEASTAGGPPSGVTDALKVLYTTESSAMEQLDGVVRLLLPEAEARAHVVGALQSSTRMLPTAARSVGALSVGFLPVVAAWD